MADNKTENKNITTKIEYLSALIAELTSETNPLLEMRGYLPACGEALPDYLWTKRDIWRQRKNIPKCASGIDELKKMLDSWIIQCELREKFQSLSMKKIDVIYETVFWIPVYKIHIIR